MKYQENAATVEGVRDAFEYWLYDHPISVPEIIEGAIKDKFGAWLDAHEDEIIEAIAKRAKPPETDA